MSTMAEMLIRRMKMKTFVHINYANAAYQNLLSSLLFLLNIK